MTEVEPGVWWLTGTRVEKAAAMTNWDYYEAQAYYHGYAYHGYTYPDPNPLTLTP